MENTCSIGKILQLKCYAGKHRWFYQFEKMKHDETWLHEIAKI